MARTTGRSSIRTIRATLATTARRIRAETAGGRLQGRTLALARGALLGVAAVTATLYAAGLGVLIGQLRGGCPPGLCAGGRVPPAVQRAFADLHLSIGAYGWYRVGLNLLFAAGFAAVAALLFWRRSRDPLALFASLALLLFGLASFETEVLVAGLAAVGVASWLPAAFLSFLGELTFGAFVFVFPDGRFVPRWALLATAAWALWWLPNTFFPGSPLDFSTWPAAAFFAGWAFLFTAMAAAQFYRYRRVSTPAQRLQTKWVVVGFIGAALGYFGGRFVVFVGAPVGPGFWPPLTAPRAVLATVAGITLIYAGMLLIPTCIGVAMLRYRLFDVDVLIRRTLVYALVTAALAATYAGCILAAQALAQALVGGGGRQPLHPAVVAASTLLVAALFRPLRRRVQAAVDRRFYRRRYDAARTLAAFGATLRTELDPAQLGERLVTAVREALQPERASLWLVQSKRPLGLGELGTELHQDVDAAVHLARPPAKSLPLPGLFAVPDGPSGERAS